MASIWYTAPAHTPETCDERVPPPPSPTAAYHAPSGKSPQDKPYLCSLDCFTGHKPGWLVAGCIWAVGIFAGLKSGWNISVWKWVIATHHSVTCQTTARLSAVWLSNQDPRTWRGDTDARGTDWTSLLWIRLAGDARSLSVLFRVHAFGNHPLKCASPGCTGLGHIPVANCTHSAFVLLDECPFAGYPMPFV